MSESRRDYLQPGQEIDLAASPDSEETLGYCIQAKVGEGGSTVCYEAMRTRGGIVETGKLKEFYPVIAESRSQGRALVMHRSESGRLYPGEGMEEYFERLCEDYVATYRMLGQVIASHPDNEMLKNFIQYSEILYSLPAEDDEEGGSRPGTVYVWSPGMKGVTLSEYFDRIHQDPKNDPDDTLLSILQITMSLTDGIRALHTAGLLHMDIKPSNFLVPYNSLHEANSTHVTMFDINTLFSIDSALPLPAGTDEYEAPEVKTGRADHRSDIYSIGVLLFEALAPSDQIPDGVYREAYYDDLPQIIRHARLIEAADSGMDPYVISHLAAILGKCLARRRQDRYDSCTDLLKDLTAVSQRVTTHVIGIPRTSGAASLRRHDLPDPELILWRSLYAHPLYETCPQGGELNVLCIGAGTYGQKFIDLCLQAGQIDGYSLRITAVSDMPQEDGERYLQLRPDLPRFVAVTLPSQTEDAGTADGGEAYAHLAFRAAAADEKSGQPVRFHERDQEANREYAEAILRQSAEEGHPVNYVFVALGKDTLSAAAARTMAAAMREQNLAGPVCCVIHGDAQEGTEEAGIAPVRTTEPLSPQEQEYYVRMAFNTHVSWMGTLNFDVHDVFNQFRADEYSFRSSLHFAMSVPYKLHSVQIDETDPVAAARRFAELLGMSDGNAQPQNRDLLDRLAAMEHRRWIMEMAADGWRAPMDQEGHLLLDECVQRGAVSDRRTRTNPCMVRSRAESRLDDAQYMANDHAKWEEPDIDPALDELDRMSLQLHQSFHRKAMQIRREDPLHSALIEGIRRQLTNEDLDVSRAFSRYLDCLKNILAGVESYTRQYDYYADCFEDALKRAHEEVRRYILGTLPLVRSYLKPVIEDNLHRDYKEYDRQLISRIPFITTWKFRPSMAMAFSEGTDANGSSDQIFKNVASATVLSPERLLYLHYFDENTDAKLLARRLYAVIHYLDRRQIHCRISMAIAVAPGVSRADRDKLSMYMSVLVKQDYSTSSTSSFDDCRIDVCTEEKDAIDILGEAVRRYQPELYDGSTHLFDSGDDIARFRMMLGEQNVPYFEFDRRRERFRKCSGCEELRYLPGRVSLRVNDIFTLAMAEDIHVATPEYEEEYPRLWALYTGKHLGEGRFEHGVMNWNRLCLLLNEYEQNRMPAARLQVPDEGAYDAEPLTGPYRYDLPSYTYDTVRKLLDELKEYGVAGPESSLSAYTSDTATLRIWLRKSHVAQIDALMREPQYLLDYFRYEVSRFSKRDGTFVDISRCELTVRNLNLDPKGNGQDRFSRDLLTRLEQERFIADLKADPDDGRYVSFRYASPRMKDMLTVAGRILEVYVYYEAMKTGYFDDVVSSYQFRWEKDDVENEIDLILTRGMSSLFVECKAVRVLEQDYYHKLHSLSLQFGVQTRMVMIGNTYLNSNEVARSANEVQTHRGAELDIDTISDPAMIESIGSVLKALMEEHLR